MPSNWHSTHSQAPKVPFKYNGHRYIFIKIHFLKKCHVVALYEVAIVRHREDFHKGEEDSVRYRMKVVRCYARSMGRQIGEWQEYWLSQDDFLKTKGIPDLTLIQCPMFFDILTNLTSVNRTQEVDSTHSN